MSAEYLAYNIGEACQVARSGRTAIYEAIRSGELRAVKRGRRTLILEADLRDWLGRLPAVVPKITNEAPRCDGETATGTLSDPQQKGTYNDEKSTRSAIRPSRIF